MDRFIPQYGTGSPLPMFDYSQSPLRKRRQELYYPVFLTLLDLLCIGLGLAAAYWFRFSIVPRLHGALPFLPLTPEGHLPADYLRLLPVAAVLFLLSHSFLHLYQPHSRVWGWEVAGRLARAACLAIALFITFLFFFRSITAHPLARWMIPLSLVSVPTLVALGRMLLSHFLRARIRRSGGGLARALVLGVGSTGKEVARTIRRHPEFGWKVVGYLSADPADLGKTLTGLRVLGDIEHLPALLESEGIEAVFVAQPDFRRELLGNVFIECQKRMVDVKIVPDVTEMLFSQVSIEELDGIPFLGLRPTPLRGWNVVIKRGFDLCVSTTLLILCAPLLLLLALWVRRDSIGPAFYRQERVGADGRRFWLTKFRTMRKDAEKHTGPVFSSPGDPRQTRAGRILRQTHLDELPQLLNVLRGEMSIVGPRPERPFFVEQFREEIPRYMARHRIKSGMTGWAQVCGQAGHEGTISERLKYDLYYIENWSVLFDVKILLLTGVWLSRRVRQIATLPPDHPSLRRTCCGDDADPPLPEPEAASFQPDLGLPPPKRSRSRTRHSLPKQTPVSTGPS